MGGDEKCTKVWMGEKLNSRAEIQAEILAVRERDPNHVMELMVKGYKNVIWGVVHNVLAGKSQAEKEDAYQEVLVKLWQGLPSLEGYEGKLEYWIGVVTKNKCLDVLKKKNPFARARQAEEMWGLSDGGVTGSEWRRELEEVEAYLQESVAGRRGRRKFELLIARALDDKLFKEIAYEDEIPLGTVQAQIARARKKMREKFPEIWAALQSERRQLQTGNEYAENQAYEGI